MTDSAIVRLRNHNATDDGNLDLRSFKKKFYIQSLENKYKVVDLLQSVSWSLAEFRHNKIVQSPHENYFNVCRQHKEK